MLVATTLTGKGGRESKPHITGLPGGLSGTPGPIWGLPLLSKSRCVQLPRVVKYLAGAGASGQPSALGGSRCLSSLGVTLASQQLAVPRLLPRAGHQNSCSLLFVHSDASRGDLAVLQAKLVFLEQVPLPLLPASSWSQPLASIRQSSLKGHLSPREVTERAQN